MKTQQYIQSYLEGHIGDAKASAKMAAHIMTLFETLAREAHGQGFKHGAKTMSQECLGDLKVMQRVTTECVNEREKWLEDNGIVPRKANEGAYSDGRPPGM